MVPRQARITHRLGNERRVPQLAAIRARHHEAVSAHPHKVTQLLTVPRHRLARRPVHDPPHDVVEHLVHRPQALVARVDVLLHNQLVRTPHASLTKRSDVHTLILPQHTEQGIQHAGVRRVQIGRRDVIPLRGPVDLVVRRRVQLRPQRLDQLRFFRTEALAVQVAHRQVHHAGVDPPAPRMNRHSVR